jgi:microcystin-dependent protein
MNRNRVSILVGSLVGATLINAAMIACGASTKASTDAAADTAAAAIGEVPAGTVVAFAGAAVPEGWLLCDGSTVSPTLYPALFGAIATQYGGDGINTFLLPDLRGRTTVGAGQGSGLTNRVLGASGGEEKHTLSIAEMPSHTHRETGTNRLDVANGGGIHVQDVDNQTFAIITTGATGGGQPHNVMPPFFALSYIIKS